MSVARAIATVGSLTLMSRVAGFVRDVLTAALLGAGPVADAFFVALKLPNFFRRLFAEGAFSVAFVPMFSAERQGRGLDEARDFAIEAQAVLTAFLVPFSLVMIAAMPALMVVLAPGFADEPEKYALAVDLSRITFPYLVLISLVALYGGVLNSLDSFGPFAAAPIAFNLTIIAGLLLAEPLGFSSGYGMAVAVAASGVVQLVWMVLACRWRGMSLPLVRPRLTVRVRRLLTLMTPGAIGAGVMQINLFVDIILASLLPTGAISYLYYADRLYQLPLGVIGIAVGTALLPVLSRHVEAGDHGAVRHYLSRGLEVSLLLALPATAGLMVAADPIIRVLFERGAFGPQESAATAATLAVYVLGIPAYVMTKVLSAAFFARQDTTSPVKIAILVALANAALALILITPLAQVGIALATGVTAWLNAGLLAWGLWRRGQLDIDARLRRRAPRIVLASLLMAVVLAGGQSLLAPWLAGPMLVRTGTLLLLLLVSGSCYFVFGHLVGAAPWPEYRDWLRRRRPPPPASP
mgnify:CR=1 FL=1